MRPSSITRLSLVLLALLGCSDQSAPTGTANTNLLGFGTSSNLIACPNDTPRSVTALVDPLLGGVLSLDDASLTIPPGALSLPTVITLTVPKTQYAEIRATALGIDHLVFNQPITATIDYSRCARPALDSESLAAWYVDPLFHSLLEKEPSADDKATHVVTFTTRHFSSYALAE